MQASLQVNPVLSGFCESTELEHVVYSPMQQVGTAVEHAAVHGQSDQLDPMCRMS